MMNPGARKIAGWIVALSLVALAFLSAGCGDADDADYMTADDYCYLGEGCPDRPEPTPTPNPICYLTECPTPTPFIQEAL